MYQILVTSRGEVKLPVYLLYHKFAKYQENEENMRKNRNFAQIGE